MIKAEELQIGNWVLFHDSGYNSDGSMWYKDRMCQVVGIGCSPRLLWIDEYGDKEEWPHGSYFDLDPIPLTPEILEMNGMHLYNRKTNDFREECNHCDCFDEDEEWRLELSLDYNGKIRWSINGDEYTIIPLDYVHQLQQALRLCGIPKEIEL